MPTDLDLLSNKTRHREVNRIDPNPLTQLLPLCLNLNTKNKDVTQTELRVSDHYQFLLVLMCTYNLSTHQVSAP